MKVLDDGDDADDGDDDDERFRRGKEVVIGWIDYFQVTFPLLFSKLRDSTYMQRKPQETSSMLTGEKSFLTEVDERKSWTSRRVELTSGHLI